nr:MAG TPA: hypothetical protein [Caudoviricetes sp.]DAT11899.1 MAG TPA: hypothetical protein [Bacteriophage sp.]
MFTNKIKVRFYLDFLKNIVNLILVIQVTISILSLIYH